MEGVADIIRDGARVAAVMAGVALLVLAWLFTSPSTLEEREQRASTLQEEGAPVAVISPLPDAVSNDTTYTLSGVASYDVDGFITTYIWEIDHNDQLEYLYATELLYKFRDTGLYKIKLTVVDNSGKSGVNFTAVYSVPDSDLDGMADWWEMDYFNGLSASPLGNPDGDAYSNLEEFVHGTNPLVPDPGEGIIEENWRWFLVAGTVAVIAAIVAYPIRRRKKKETERKKMEMAVEIQKALEEE
jgi:hypothetical protein